MVTELGGEVKLEDRENKRGCKFIVCLPEDSLKAGRGIDLFYYIVDDDEVFRSMLSQIIEDGDLGEVIGEADDGAFIEADQLNFKSRYFIY